MRNLILLLVLLLVAAPLAAQQKGAYQKPTTRELELLRRAEVPELRHLQAGNQPTQVVLLHVERKQLEELAKAHGEHLKLLRQVKAGAHFHHGHWWDDWVFYFLLPGIGTTACVCVLLVFLIVL
ncbi:MAG: hypothetical protein M5U25_10195 [Planctomycetota bacterium]|nr:hypothetical protein [Planctomycetota bacterium]